MNKFFKFNLSAILVSLMAFSASAQLINGKLGDQTTLVKNGEAKALVASGCPAGTYFDWGFYQNSPAGGTVYYPMADWDGAYSGNGVADNNVTALAMTLDNKPGGNIPPYVYELKCVTTLGGSTVAPGTMASKITIQVVDPATYAPSVSPLAGSIVCADINDPNSGSISLKATGCPDGTLWYLPNNKTVEIANWDAIKLSGSDFITTRYSVSCIINYSDNTAALSSATNVPKKEYSRAAGIDVTKGYTPPTLTVSSVKALLPDNSTKEVCKGSLVDLTTNVPDFNRYNNFFEFRWYAYDEYVPGKNILGAQRFGATVNGNVLTAIAEKKSVIYYVDLKDRAGVCGTKESNQVRITYVDLPKPGPITGNLGYCIEGTTTLKVDSASLVRNEGYLISTGVPTKPSIFRWYVDGVETAALGNASSIIFKQNAKVKVDYVSNYNCPSPISDEVTIKNYDKPVTPTITALKPANGSLVTASTVGFCEGTPIAGQLQASSLPNGEATKWEWSNALTTSLIDYNKVGSFTVKTINSNGCYSESSAAVEVKVLALPAAPTITAGSATTFCARKEDDYSAFNAVTLTASTSNSIVNWYGNANTSLSTLKVFEGIKTSDTYYTRATDIYGCISPASNKIKVSVQQNPVATDARIVKEGVYTLKALNFPATVTGGTASDYEWKFGTTALPSKSYITKVKTNGDYSVRRKYLYAIDGFPLTCYTDFTKYAYTLDPEFNGVAIFPNPVTKPDVDGVNIQILDDWTNATVTLYDMVGRPVYSGKIPALNAANPEPTNILKLPGLGNGIYIVTITADNSKSYTGKIIVSK